MSAVRVMLGSVLVFCLVVVGTWLIILSMPFLGAILVGDWHTVVLRGGFLASGICMLIITDMITRKVRRKTPDAS